METLDPVGLKRRRSKEWREEGIKGGLSICALVSMATTVGIIVVLFTEALHFFVDVPTPFPREQKPGFLEFLFGTKWSPLIEPRFFGVLPLVCGTLLIVAGSSLFALPVGLASAIYLSEYAGARTRNILKPILEVLAGVPTIVYGYFALTFITPILKTFLPVGVFNAASGSLVVGIMVLPMVVSLCDDAFRAVPASLRNGGYAVGATNYEVSTRIVVPAALSGVMAAFVLAFSRAIGETMAVTLAAGATPNLTFNPLESVQTMTAYIVQVSLGDTPQGTLEYYTIFAVGALLFVITLFTNLVAHRIMRRFREEYE